MDTGVPSSVVAGGVACWAVVVFLTAGRCEDFLVIRRDVRLGRLGGFCVFLAGGAGFAFLTVGGGVAVRESASDSVGDSGVARTRVPFVNLYIVRIS